MSRTASIHFLSEMAEQHYAFARWVMGKAAKQRHRYETGLSNDYIIRVNQFTEEMRLGAMLSAGSRYLMDVEDSLTTDG